MQSGKMTVSVRLWKTGSENIRLSRKNEKIPGKRFALPGMAFLPVPIPALAAGRRAVVTM